MVARSNGSGGGTVQIVSLGAMGALAVAMFGMWWNSADPGRRIDKIEATVVDVRKESSEITTSMRKELNENIASIRREMGSGFLTTREHADFVSRFTANVSRIELAADEAIKTFQTRFEAAQTKEAAADATKRIEARIDTLIAGAVFSVWKEANETRIKDQTTRIEGIRDVANGRFLAINADLERLKGDLVSRSEHQEHWRETDLRITALQVSMGELNKAINAIHNPGDAFKDVQAQIKELRDKLMVTR